MHKLRFEISTEYDFEEIKTLKYKLLNYETKDIKGVPYRFIKYKMSITTDLEDWIQLYPGDVLFWTVEAYKKRYA